MMLKKTLLIKIDQTKEALWERWGLVRKNLLILYMSLVMMSQGGGCNVDRTLNQCNGGDISTSALVPTMTKLSNFT